MSRRRSREAMVAHWHAFRDGARGRGVRRADRAPRLREDPRVLGVRLPQGARRRVRAARLPERLAAPPPPRRVPVRAAERAADGLLPAGLAGARRAAPRRRGARRRRQRLARRLCSSSRTARCGSASATCAASGEPAAPGLVRGARATAARSATWPTSRAAPGSSLPDCERLIAAGACDAFGPRRELLWRAG